MKLRNLIQVLEELSKEHGDNMRVIMADNISVSKPIFSTKYPDKKNVVITDKE